MDSLVSATGDPYVPPPLPDTDTSFWTMCKDIIFKDVPPNVYETFRETLIGKHAHHGHLHRLTIEETAAVVLYTWDFKQPGGTVVNPYHRLNKGCAERSLDPLLLPFYWNLVSAYDKLPKVRVDKLYRGLSSGIVSTSGGGGTTPPTYRVGKDVRFVAFTSTSKQQDKAKGFIPSTGVGALVMYEGCEGVEMKTFSIFPGEDEVLLCPNGLYHVTSVLSKDRASTLADVNHDLVVLSSVSEDLTTTTRSQSKTFISLFSRMFWLVFFGLFWNPYIHDVAIALSFECALGFGSKTCYVKALEIDPNDSYAWNGLGTVGGGTVSGVAYDETTCYVKALEIDWKYSNAWNNLGTAGGGTIRDEVYDKETCFLTALAMDPKNSNAWYGLGTVGGGHDVARGV